MNVMYKCKKSLVFTNINMSTGSLNFTKFWKLIWATQKIDLGGNEHALFRTYRLVELMLYGSKMTQCGVTTCMT